jgi:hypothetical protein
MDPTSQATWATLHRRWLWDGHEVDLQANDLPLLVRVAVLAHRDARTDEDQDAAAYLAWAVEEHPPWTGGCERCLTGGPCSDQRQASEVVLEFLIRRSTAFIASAKSTIARLEQKGRSRD